MARWVRAVALVAALIVVAGACTRRSGAGQARRPDARRELVASTATTADMYRRAGLIAEAAPVPFVGAVRYLDGPRDSTLVLLSVSMPARALTFVRDGERYRAGYSVIADLRQAGVVRKHVEATEVVRVTAYKETTRSDESIIFQHVVVAAPGEYAMTLTVRDESGMRSSLSETTLTIPDLGPGDLSSPVPTYTVTPRSSTDSLLAFTASPRATAHFGRDTMITVYLEAYGAATGAELPIRATVRTLEGAIVWSALGQLPRRGAIFSGTLAIPAGRIGIGIGKLEVAREDTKDSAATPLLVTFGDDIAVVSFEEMVSYLRYFTSPFRLQQLRDLPPAERAAGWARLMAETDPVTSTPEHEGLREYFERIQQSNERFREEGSPGWLSDRGMVFITLGEPDQVLEQTTGDLGQRGRLQGWEYRQHHVQLVFVDQTGFGRWRLTTSSEADFNTLVNRIRMK